VSDRRLPALHRTLIAVATLCVAMGAAACGATVEPLHARPTVPPASGTGLLPDHDTPIGQAPQKLADAWAVVDLQVIPSKHVYDSVPAVPVTPQTKVPAMAADEALRVATGVVREAAVIGWADAHHELGIRARVDAPATSVGPTADALGAGATVQHPACDLNPTAITIAPVDTETRTFFERLNQPLGAGDVAVVLEYTGPCSVVAHHPDGHTSVISSFTASRTVEAGRVVDDTLLGGVFHADGVAGCASKGMPAQLCGATP
jgi:hypothetical protein